jgi:flagellar hook-length control protein FliK
MMLNTVTSSTPAQPAGASQAPVAGQPVAAQATNGAADAALPPAGAQPFAQWLGLQIDAGMPALAPVQQPPGAVGDAQAAPAEATSDETASDDAAAAAPAQDGTLLAAMSLPLMPLSSLQAAQALQAMVPAAGGMNKNTASADGDAGTSVSAPGARQGAVDTLRGPSQHAVAAVSDGTTGDAQSFAQGGGQGNDQNSNRTAAIALPAIQQAQQAQQDGGAAATRLSVHAAAEGQDAPAASGPSNAAMNAAAVAGAPTQAAPVADTVKLAGPPTAWRQSLQEALGERLNVQVTKNMEQAVIRLEPPQLGRIDIAIRHSAGTLEVNITASNGEVLRQLQTVSDNLRSDLSQRQFTDVAVTVAPTPKNTGSTPFGDPQQQGRSRQQGRDQESEPGRALAEAGNPSSAFSLDGRG